MKKNKACLRRQGFVGLGILIAIIAALAIGGGAYYMGENSNTLPKLEENNLQQKEQSQNNVVNVPVVNISTQNITTTSTTISCIKENNCCIQATDCKYISYTGGCNTPEYVVKKNKEAVEQGMQIGEAPPRENVTCTCESNKCVAHN
ncbi:MAG: hypothetical protein WAV10_03630 [Minisyncoccia bacterium]